MNDNFQRGTSGNLTQSPLGSRNRTVDNNNISSKLALNNGPAPLSLTKPSMGTLDPTLGGHSLLAPASSNNSSRGASTSGDKNTSNDNGAGMASVHVLQGSEGNGTTVTKLTTADDIKPISREDSSLEFRSGSLRGRKVKAQRLRGKSPERNCEISEPSPQQTS